jgi:polyhydroxyalkanoate synthesis regulator phasin
MSTRYEINRFEEVMPIRDGRVSTDTREYRGATELELQQREEIAILEERIKELEERIEELEEV